MQKKKKSLEYVSLHNSSNFSVQLSTMNIAGPDLVASVQCWSKRQQQRWWWFLGGSSLALASPGGPGGGVCSWQELTDSANLMPDRSLLPQGWPCAALIWLGKGEGLDVTG